MTGGKTSLFIIIIIKQNIIIAEHIATHHGHQ